MGYDAPGPPERRSNLYSLTRLLLGGALVGYDGLVKRLSQSEAKLDDKGPVLAEQAAKPDNFTQVPSTWEPYEENNETQSDRLRFALIGLIFDTQDSVNRGLGSVDHLSLRAGKLLDRLTSPVYRSRIFSPFRTRVDELAQRGQNEVDRWIDVGRKEEKGSRELARIALTEQVDNSIQYLTSNSEVQELVQSQSVGLIGEIVEETRERTVSADYFIEAWARTILRRPLRSELPEPPQDLKLRALPFKRIQGKIVKK
jgi:hypothetical protein